MRRNRITANPYAPSKRYVLWVFPYVPLQLQKTSRLMLSMLTEDQRILSTVSLRFIALIKICSFIRAVQNTDYRGKNFVPRGEANGIDRKMYEYMNMRLKNLRPNWRRLPFKIWEDFPSRTQWCPMVLSISGTPQLILPFLSETTEKSMNMWIWGQKTCVHVERDEFVLLKFRGLSTNAT